MADTTFVADHHVPSRAAVGLVARFKDALRLSLAELGETIAEARRELKLHQAMRSFDRRQLRDLGLDRNAC